MNQCEKVMLEKMLEIRHVMRLAELGAPQLDRDKCISEIMLLLDCICEWRNPQETPVEDGWQCEWCGEVTKGKYADDGRPKRCSKCGAFFDEYEEDGDD